MLRYSRQLLSPFADKVISFASLGTILEKCSLNVSGISISYRVVPSRKGAAHRQLSIDKTRLVMLTWDTPEQTTLSGDI